MSTLACITFTQNTAENGFIVYKFVLSMPIFCIKETRGFVDDILVRKLTPLHKVFYRGASVIYQYFCKKMNIFRIYLSHNGFKIYRKMHQIASLKNFFGGAYAPRNLYSKRVAPPWVACREAYQNYKKIATSPW